MQSFELKPTTFFLEQLRELSYESKKLIEEKLILVKENPFRYKRIIKSNLFLFRIRFEDMHREKRLIYLVDKPKIILVCILDRGKDYKDLEKYLRKTKLL